MISASPQLKLDLLALLSFFIMLLFTTQYNSTYAQVTKNYVGITSTAVKNNNTLIFEQQSQASVPIVFVPQPVLPPSLTNHSIEVPAISTFNNHRYLQQPPPIANAGHAQVVTSGSTVFLNGSKSRSPNGIILGYSWKQIPTGSISLGVVNSPLWEFSAPKVTTNTLLRFQLNVTDNLGQTGSTIVNVLDKPALIGIHTSPSTQIVKPTTNAINNKNAPILHSGKSSLSPPLTPPINNVIPR